MYYHINYALADTGLFYLCVVLYVIVSRPDVYYSISRFIKAFRLDLGADYNIKQAFYNLEAFNWLQIDH